MPLHRLVDLECGSSAIISRFADDRPNSGVGVLEVWTSITLEGDHTIEVEDIITHQVVAEIGILDRTNADRSANGVEFFWIKPMGRRVWILGTRSNLFSPPLNRFGKQAD